MKSKKITAILCVGCLLGITIPSEVYSKKYDPPVYNPDPPVQDLSPLFKEPSMEDTAKDTAIVCGIAVGSLAALALLWIYYLSDKKIEVGRCFYKTRGPGE